jgi:hypothetical protein
MTEDEKPSEKLKNYTVAKNLLFNEKGVFILKIVAVDFLLGYNANASSEKR